MDSETVEFYFFDAHVQRSESYSLKFFEVSNILAIHWSLIKLLVNKNFILQFQTVHPENIAWFYYVLKTCAWRYSMQPTKFLFQWCACGEGRNSQSKCRPVGQLEPDSWFNETPNLFYFSGAPMYFSTLDTWANLGQHFVIVQLLSPRKVPKWLS